MAIAERSYDLNHVEIYEAGIGDADLVVMMVYDLLSELNERPSTEAQKKMFLACRELLEEDSPSRALIALDGNQRPVSVMTLTEAQGLSSMGTFGIIMEHYVIPEARSLGIGEKLLEKTVEIAKEEGWSLLQVAAPHGKMAQRTQNFYARNQFVIAGDYMQLTIENIKGNHGHA